MAEIAGGTDCNDSNSQINPGMSEDFTDGLDNDCDGVAEAEGVIMPIKIDPYFQ